MDMYSRITRVAGLAQRAHAYEINGCVECEILEVVSSMTWWDLAWPQKPTSRPNRTALKEKKREHLVIQFVKFIISLILLAKQQFSSVTVEFNKYYIRLKHDGNVPTCFNQSKASISFDYIAYSELCARTDVYTSA